VNYLTFYRRFKDFPLIDLRDVFTVFPDFDRRRISEWQGKGYLKKIVNNYYVFADQTIDEKILFFIANKIYEPSYVSLETALAFYGLIPEGAFNVFSVSTAKTRTVNVNLKPIKTKFVYKRIKKDLFWGYKLVKTGNVSFLIAEPEKALLDFLYLREDLRLEDDFFELRINRELFKKIVEGQKMKKYLKIANPPILEGKIKILKKIHA